MKTLKSIILFLAVAVCCAAQSFGIISPNLGSSVAPGVITWTWGPAPGALAYNLYLSKSGYFQTDLGSCGVASTTCVITVNYTGLAYLTLQGITGTGGTTTYGATLIFGTGGQPQSNPNVILSPASGSTISNPPVFQVSIPSTTGQVLFSEGYNGVGSSDIQYTSIGQWQGQTNYALQLANVATSDVHPQLFIRLSWNGINNDYVFNTPAPAGTAVAQPSTSNVATFSTSGNADDYPGAGTVLNLPNFPPPANLIPGAINTPAPGNIPEGSTTFTWNPAVQPPYYLSASFYNYGYTDGGYCFGIMVESCTVNLTQAGPLYVSLAWYDANGNIQSSSGMWTVTTGGGGNFRTAKQVRTSKGLLEVPRGDLADLGQFSYSWSQTAAGYHFAYTMDNTDVARIRIGEDSSYDATASTMPERWAGGRTSWYAVIAPERSRTAQYTMESPWLPGPVMLYIQEDYDGSVAAMNGETPPARHHPIAMQEHSRDNGAIAHEVSIWRNSVRKVVVGPAFAASNTRDENMGILRTWIGDLPFLAPLFKRGGTVDDLKPSNQLESDIVTCLRKVL